MTLVHHARPGVNQPADDARPAGVARRPRSGTLYLAAAVALLLHAIAYSLGSVDARGAGLALWYAGLVLLVGSFTVLLTAPGVSDRQRLGGSVAYGLAMYASWLLASPVLATRFDETLHVATLVNLLQDGLFSPNSMLPVSPHYPGLELAAAGVVWVSGVPLVVAQVVVVALARTLLVLGLFSVGSRLGRSSRVGALTVLLYSSSAHFYFFIAQFSYQTVAIAALVAAMALLLQASEHRARRTWLLMGAAQASLGVVTVAHHVTSWITLVGLWALAGLLALGGERRRARLTLVTAELATLVAALWTTVVAPLLIEYLSPLADEATSELVRLVTLDDSGSRTMLSSGSGTPTPLWQTGTMFLAILVWCLLLVPSLIGAVRGTTVARSSARLVVVAVAAAYPVLFAVRFFPTAAEIADRASSFVTLGTALVVALWAVRHLDRYRLLVVPTVVLLVLGGLLLGGGQDWQRLPGPYLPGAEQRSVDATTISVARWAGRYLPEGSRIASDVTLDRVLPDFAPVVPVTQQSSGVNLTPVFIAEAVDDDVIEMVQRTAVDFILVDTRTIGVAALSGSYYEAGSAFGEGADQPTATMLLKFRDAPGFDLVLDGPIQVYDVRSLRGEPRTFADRADPGLPGRWVPWQVVVCGLVVLGAVTRRRALLGTVLAQASGRTLWVVALALPTVVLLGAAGVASGMHPVAGAAVLLGVVLALLRATGAGRSPGPLDPGGHEGTGAGRRSSRPSSGDVVVVSATVAILVVAGVVSVTSSWRLLVRDIPESWGPPGVSSAPRVAP